MKLPRYSEYKDSGVSWIGEVPSHWSIRRLKEIVKFSGGGTPARDNPAFWNGDIPWISPKDMKSELVVSSEESITAAGLAGSASSLVPQGALLMVVRSGILKHTIPVGVNTIPVALNQDMKALHPNGVRTDFLLRWVQGLNDRLLLAWAKQGATVESIEHDYLANTLVPYPDDGEQRAIAAFLGRETAKIDALIAEQERLLELLAEKRQAVISHAVTKGLNPDAPMKDSGVAWLGEVPAHWRVVRFGDVCLSIATGPFGTSLGSDDYISGGVPVINPSHIVDNELAPEQDVSVTAETAQRLSYWTLRDGDIVVARRGELGRAAVVDQRGSGWICGTGSLRVTPNGEQSTADFLHACLQARFAREWLNQASVGSTMANLNQGILARLPIALPPSTIEQSGLLEALKVRLSEVAHAESLAKTCIDLLRERRSALIAAAVTGQIDVREAA